MEEEGIKKINGRSGWAKKEIYKKWVRAGNGCDIEGGLAVFDNPNKKKKYAYILLWQWIKKLNK